MKQEVHSTILRGDNDSLDRAAEIIGSAMFPKSRSYTGNARITLRITHPEIGRRYSPPDNYGAHEWVRAFLYHSNLDQGHQDELSEFMNIAGERPLNVLERAAYEAIVELTRDQTPKKIPARSTDVQRLAVPAVLASFGQLVSARLQAGRLHDHAGSAIDSETLIFDIARAYEIHLWFYWVQLYLGAESNLRAIKRGEAPREGTLPIFFGYETEQIATRGRPFTTERERLEKALYRGALASIALSNVHAALGWDKAIWFDELTDYEERNDGTDLSPRLVAWLNNYKDLALNEKGRTLNTPVPPTLTISEGISSFYDAIAEYYKELGPSARMPYTTTYGLCRSLGYSDDCPLIFKLSGNRGATLMIDHTIILLFGRLLAGAERKVRFNLIVEALENLGMVLDETTKDHVVSDLEDKGLLQSLSDSGEAMYVEVY